MLERALGWLARGIAVIPVRGKEPIISEWRSLQNELPSPAKVRRWMVGATGYGIVAGWRGLVILDFDRGDWYRAWQQWARARGGIAQIVSERSYTVMTRKGAHVYVFSATPHENIALRHRFDLLSKARYALGAGSLHPAGLVYEAVNESAPIVHVHDVREILPPFVLDAAPAPPVYTRPLTTDLPLQVLDDPLTELDTTRPALGATVWRRAKEAMPIQDLLGVELVKKGQHYGMACCPMHNDEHPSLSVDLVSNRVSCRAGCTGPHGWDLIDAYMWRANETDRLRAARILAGELH